MFGSVLFNWVMFYWLLVEIDVGLFCWDVCTTIVIRKFTENYQRLLPYIWNDWFRLFFGIPSICINENNIITMYNINRNNRNNGLIVSNAQQELSNMKLFKYYPYLHCFQAFISSIQKSTLNIYDWNPVRSTQLN